MNKEIKYSIICCLYNEINILKKKFENFINFTEKFTFEYEIFFIDNNSKDGSREFLKKIELKKIPNLKFIFNNENLGKGGSITKCCTLSKGKYCVIFDIDEYLPEDIINGDSHLSKQNFDFLIGSRILAEKKKFIYRKNLYGVILLTKLINWLFKTKLTDAAGATKFFRKEIYDQLKISTKKFDFEFDLICKFSKKNLKIGEFSSHYFPRSYEEGKKIKPFIDGLYILKTILINFIIRL